MKSILTLTFTLIAASILYAQSSGIITYSESVKMNIEIDGDVAGGMDLSEFLPESMTSSYNLSFNGKVSSYKKVNDDNSNMELGDEDAGIKIVIMGDDLETDLHVDRSTKMVTELKGFMGKAFIVEESLDKLKWKITGEKVKYLDYECIKATRTNSEGEEVVAWFAPQLPVSVGPQLYGDLPGAILMLSQGEEDVVIKATNIELKEVGSIHKPTKGEKVTSEEYEKIVEEKTKEMMQQHGGSGITIRG